MVSSSLPGKGLFPLLRRALQEPVALVLAALIVLRPWSDGIVLPQHTVYYVWALAVLSAWTALGALRRGDRMRHKAPLALLAGFYTVALLTGFRSILPDTTYRALVWWTGSLGVFFVAANALRTRMAIGIVAGAFVVSSLYEAAYSLLHLHYKLPFMRMLVNLNPGVLPGVTSSASMAHRLESNRAFGSFLFPNALAAFLILGIPYAGIAAYRSFRQLRQALGKSMTPTTVQKRASRQYAAAAVALVAWFIVFLSASLAVLFILSPYKYYTLQTVAGTVQAISDPLLAHPLEWGIWMALAPLLVAAAVLVGVRVYGWGVAWRAIQLFVFGASLCFETLALVLTYSRGAVLGLLTGLAAAGLLLWMLQRRPANGSTYLASGIKMALVLCLAWGACSLAGAQAEPSAVNAKIDIQGDKAPLAGAMNPASFRLRLTYWKTGVSMLQSHWLTGVGLGAFETAYPVYQRLGSGDVKMAHNDYLQMFCETGILGIALFVAFWLYFTVWGARRILSERDGATRWSLLGIYAGVLAFLAHSAVDFNFQNASLAFFVFLLAGVFYALAIVDAPTAPSSPLSKLVLTVVVLVSALTAAAQFRVHAVDGVLEDSNGAFRTLSTARDLLERTAREKFNPAKPPRWEHADIAALIPNPADQFAFAKLLVIVNTTARYLSPNESIPSDTNAQVWVELRDPAVARAKLDAATGFWIEQLEAIDASYPKSPRMAALIYQWCELKALCTGDADRARWVLKACAWAEQGVQRSPWSAGARAMLGRAIRLRADTETDPRLARSLVEKSISVFQEATQLYPTSQEFWRDYAGALESAAAFFSKAGDSARSGALILDAQNAKVKATEIEEYKRRTQTGATG